MHHVKTSIVVEIRLWANRISLNFLPNLMHISTIFNLGPVYKEGGQLWFEDYSSMQVNMLRIQCKCVTTINFRRRWNETFYPGLIYIISDFCWGYNISCSRVSPRPNFASHYSILHVPDSPVSTCSRPNRLFSHDATAAILVSQNNETAAMLESQTSPVGVELFSYAKTFFCCNKFA